MDQVRRIDQLTLAELFAIKESQGENTSEAVLEAIREKELQAQAQTLHTQTKGGPKAAPALSV